MTQQVIIYLANGVAPSWVVLSNGQVVTSAWQAPSSQLPDCSEATVTVVVPQEDVLLTSVTLPKMSQHRLRQALPFALEEQLIAELSQLHFAHGVPSAGEPLNVAVVAHTKMQQWLDQCRAWGVTPQHMVTAAHFLPEEKNAWHVWLTTIAIVRTSAGIGFACDVTNMLTYLDALLASDVPQVVHVYQSTDAALTVPPSLTSLMQVTARTDQQCLEDFALRFNPSRALNLLQAAYTTKTSHRIGAAKMKRILVGFALTWLLAIFTYPVVDQLILQQRVQAIDGQIAQIYRQHFPQATSVVTPQLRLEEKRRKLLAAQGENHVLVLLAYVGEGMKQVSGLTLNRVDYQAQQLSLQLSANSSETLTMFSNVLQGHGLQVHQQNADIVDNRINATIQIE